MKMKVKSKSGDKIASKNKFSSNQKKRNREVIREKALKTIAKNPDQNVVKKSKPKKELHREFKRQMKLYMEMTKKMSPDTLFAVKTAKEKLLRLLSKDLNKSYSWCFVYMKQLALTLYKAIKENKKVSIYPVYNWQFMSSLDLWTDFMCQHSANHEYIASLASPLIMLINGVIRLQPSTRYIPLKLHCLKMLHTFAVSLNQVVPVLGSVVEILNSVNFNRRNKKGQTKTMNLMSMLHFSTSQLQTYEFLDLTFCQLFQIVVEHVDLYATSPTFPYMVAPVIHEMKKFSKACKVPQFSSDFKTLRKKIEIQASFVQLESLKKPGTEVVIPDNAVWKNFVSKYYERRLMELEAIMQATMNLKFTSPEEDFVDRGKTEDDVEKDKNDDFEEDDENFSDLEQVDEDMEDDDDGMDVAYDDDLSE